MNMIVAADKNWAIGHKGDLLVSIPEDHRFFRETTTGKVVVMGRKTLESLPGKMPLAKRTNIVLSRKKDYKVKGAAVVHSMEECLEELRKYDSDDIYIIGGSSIYRAFLPYTDVIHLTKIDYTYQGDVYFPDLTKEEDWVLTGESEEQTYFDLIFYFQRYERKKRLVN